MSADGIWNTLIDTPMGKQKVVLDLKVDGTKVVGTADQNGVIYPVDGTVDGAELKWKVPVKQPMPMTLSFTVVIDGDTLTGKVKPGILPAAAITGERA